MPVDVPVRGGPVVEGQESRPEFAVALVPVARAEEGLVVGGDLLDQIRAPVPGKVRAHGEVLPQPGERVVPERQAVGAPIHVVIGEDLIVILRAIDGVAAGEPVPASVHRVRAGSGLAAREGTGPDDPRGNDLEPKDPAPLRVEGPKTQAYVELA